MSNTTKTPRPHAEMASRYMADGLIHLDEANANLRPGALDYLKHPSRRGNKLFYADGLVEVMV